MQCHVTQKRPDTKIVVHVTHKVIIGASKKLCDDNISDVIVIYKLR